MRNFIVNYLSKKTENKIKEGKLEIDNDIEINDKSAARTPLIELNIFHQLQESNDTTIELFEFSLEIWKETLNAQKYNTLESKAAVILNILGKIKRNHNLTKIQKKDFPILQERERAFLTNMIVIVQALYKTSESLNYFQRRRCNFVPNNAALIVIMPSLFFFIYIMEFVPRYGEIKQRMPATTVIFLNLILLFGTGFMLYIKTNQNIAACEKKLEELEKRLELELTKYDPEYQNNKTIKNEFKQHQNNDATLINNDNKLSEPIMTASHF